MQIFSGQRKITSLVSETQIYVWRYQMIYRKLIKGAKRREVDNYAFNANNGTVTVWQLINKISQEKISKWTQNWTDM